MGESNSPCICSLKSICRPDHGKVRYDPQGHDLLDRLVCGPVLSQTDAVMGEDVYDAYLREAGKPDGGPHIICKRQECGSIGDYPAMERHAGGNCPHGVLPNPEMDIPSAVIPAAAHGPLNPLL